MANILDYLRWRGDLDWRSSPLNDVDLLILAQLSYVNFDGQLSGEGRMDQQRSLAQTCAQLIEQDPQGRAVHQTSYLWAGNRQLLTLLSTCPRFSQMDMAGYHSVLDRQAQTQFGAVTYPLPRGGAVVAFRGTDDSLTGWQEDMALSYGDPAPAQRRAHLYLEKAAQAFPGALYLCGHSKGGNLAVYAAACAGPQVQRRIQRLCSFDGPGQQEALVRSPGYRRIRERLRLYVPHFSIVGMLLEHEEAYQVVASEGGAIAQHNAFSWQVLGPAFVSEAALSPESEAANRVLRQWIQGMDEESRRRFSQAVYTLLAATQADTLSQLAQTPLQSARAALRELYNMNPAEKQTLHTAFNALFGLALRNLPLPWRRDGKGGRPENKPENGA